jgi:hypothetical protein
MIQQYQCKLNIHKLNNLKKVIYKLLTVNISQIILKFHHKFHLIVLIFKFLIKKLYYNRLEINIYYLNQ